MCNTKEETKICTGCEKEFPLSNFPYSKPKCTKCFRENRWNVRQALSERNGCKTYGEYQKLLMIKKLYAKPNFN